MCLRPVGLVTPYESPEYSIESTPESLSDEKARVRFTVIDGLSRHYRGEPYPDHETPSLAVFAAVQRWHSFGEI